MPSPPPSIATSLPTPDILPSSPPAPLASKFQLLNHLRRRSATQPNSRGRSLSSYETWIDQALSLAHSSTVEQEIQEPESAMVRMRASSAQDGNNDASRTQRPQTTTQLAVAQPQSEVHTSNQTYQLPREDMPTIRLIPHYDNRSARPSLTFPATTRTLPSEDCIIRVGRYSERDINPVAAPNIPSSAPIGFKSKVVSRRHCEFWCSKGQWHIKDVKSSSGTFLNHIRLSQPNIESRPFPVNDGDVIQLGIDFRGGEEMIFRCVKIRVECNRGWQKQLNNYNVSAHKRLRDLGKTAAKKDSDTASTHSSQECSICLMSIAPCQSLFVAPCSHVWHYKCIRPILNDHKTYPQFLCPNCRYITDLDAEVDDPLDDPVRWEDEDEVVTDQAQAGGLANGDTQLTREHTQLTTPNTQDVAMQNAVEVLNETTSQSLIVEGSMAAPSSGASQPLYARRNQATLEQELPGSNNQFLRPITPTEPLNADDLADGRNVDMLVREGPMTPTNTAGPFLCG